MNETIHLSSKTIRYVQHVGSGSAEYGNMEECHQVPEEGEPAKQPAAGKRTWAEVASMEPSGSS